MNRTCLEPGCPDLAVGASRRRCPRHQAGWDRQRWASRPSTAQRGYGAAYRRRRAALIEAHVGIHGWTCPGHRTPPHPVAPGALTADHVVPVSRGGQDGPLRVLCLACNVRRGAGR